MWINHLEIERIKSERAERKETFDFNVAKFKYHTFWWLFGLAIFGGLYSVYDIINSLTKEECEQQEQMPTIKKELGVSKLPALILGQKSLDSLHNSKTHADSLKMD